MTFKLNILNWIYSPSQSRPLYFQHFYKPPNCDPKLLLELELDLCKHGEIYYIGFHILKFKSKKF